MVNRNDYFYQFPDDQLYAYGMRFIIISIQNSVIKAWGNRNSLPLSLLLMMLWRLTISLRFLPINHGDN